MFKALFKGSVFKLYDFVRPLVIIPFFIRSYGIDSYGIYIQIILTATLLYPILDLGIGMGIQRFSDKLKSVGAKIEIFGLQRVCILLFCLVYAVTMTYSSSVQNLLFGGYQSASIIIVTLFYIIFFGLNNTLQGVLRSESKIGELVIYRGVFTGVETLLLLLVLYFYDRFDYFYILVMVFCQFIYFLLLNREINGLMLSISLNFKISKESKSFFKYSLAIIPSALIGWVTSSSDRFFITDYFGSEYTGYYSAIAQYAGYMKLIVFPFTFVFFKEYSRLYDKDFKKFLRFYSKTFLLCIVISLVYFLLFYLVKYPIFEQYVGLEIKPEFNALVFWFLVSFLLINIASFLTTYMLVSNQTKIMIYAIGAGALINFILNKFLLKDFTYINSAYYWAISVGIQIIILGIFVIRNIRLNEKSFVC
jgi:O-antigen/teichoic acid export membrane protein